MQLRVEVSRTSCYVGEPIIATYKLYTRLKSESKLIQNPSFNGFSVIDLQEPNITGYTQEKLNGKTYNVYIIRKAQLYPLQAGNIELEAAVLENNIQFIKEAYAHRVATDVRDIFDDFSQSSVPADAVINHTENLSSIPVNIVVKPLPETSKPAGFNGGVGSFTLDAILEKKNFTTDEAGKLSITISGKGNMQLVTAPEISWPSLIEPFESRIYDDLSKTTVPVSGSKTFEYPFSVNTAGTYRLPAIQFVFFDPQIAKYKIIETGALDFTVTKGSSKKKATPLALVKSEDNFLNGIFSHRWLFVSLIACIILIGLIIWLKVESRKEKQMKEVIRNQNRHVETEQMQQMAKVNQENPLSESERCLYQGELKGFYQILNKELKNYLANKFSITESDFSVKTISAEMDKYNIPNTTVLKLVQVLNNIEVQLYTPFEESKKLTEVYSSAQEVIREINSYTIKNL